MTFPRSLLLGLICSIPIFGTTSRAADLYWDNDSTSTFPFFTDASFWSTDAALTLPAGAAPVAGDNIFFLFDGGAYDVILTAGNAATNVTASNGDVTLTGPGGTLNSSGAVSIDDPFAAGLLDGARVTLNIATWDNVGDAVVGDAGFGTLTVNGGGDFEADQLFVGNQAGGEGEVTLTGEGTTLTATLNSNTGVHVIGNAGGTGTVNVLDGADLRTTSTGANDIWVGSGTDGGDPAVASTGTLNVDGAGSFAETEDLNVGIFGGTGYLNITGGAQVINTDGSSPDTNFGVNSGPNDERSSGFGVVDGDGSLLRSRAIVVGSSGTGQLEVRDGAVAQTFVDTSTPSNMTIGDQDGSDGKVAVHGSGVSASLLDVEDSLLIGRIGLGQLNIGRDINDNPVGTGELQVDGNVIIGDEINNVADNRLVISGASALANAGGVIRIGNEGRGTMEILDGATVTSATGRIGEFGFAGAEGSVTVDGANSSWDMTGDLYVGVQGGTGTLNVTDGAFVGSDNDFFVGNTAGSRGTVLVSGAGSQLAPVDDNNSGVDVVIGNSGVGQVTVEDGALFFVETEIYLAFNASGNGRLTVQDAGSLTTIGENPTGAANELFIVGNSGRARVEILNGGEIESERTIINHIAPDMAVFDEAFSETFLVSGMDGQTASLLRTFGRIEVGNTRQASLRIADGGQVISNDGIARGGAGDSLTTIGNGAAADNSSVVITGAGTKWFDAYDPVGEVQDDNDFVVGNSAAGVTLDIEDGGALQSGRGVVARLAGSGGSVTVTGAGSRWDATSMIVGNLATGTMLVSNGGTVVADGLFEVGNGTTGDGTLTVTGAGSNTSGTTYSVGDSNGAVGVVNVTQGGLVSSTVSFNLGEVSGGNGTATIGTTNAGDPTATLDIANNLNAGGNDGGDGGTGTLNVEASGVVNVASTLTVFDQGTVNLNGGTINTSDLDVVQIGDFNFNTGTLRFTSDKTLNTSALDEIFAGAAVPTLAPNQHLAVTGTAMLTEPLRMNGGTLSVGSITPASLANVDFDAGTLNYTNQDLDLSVLGSLTITEPQTIRVVPNPSGNAGAEVLVQPDTTLTVVGQLEADTIFNEGDLVWVDPTGAGRTVTPDLITFADSNTTLVGDTTFNGSVSGPGDFFGPGTATFAGGFSPGSSPGEVSFEGNVALDNANTLFIEIGGDVLGDDYDSLTIGGDATLDGLLDVSLLGEFTPTAGQQFTVLTAASITDNGLALVGSAASEFNLIVGPTSVLLQAASALQGDFNGDGMVSLADYTVWRDNLGAANESAINNAGDGLAGVDLGDYTLWKTNFGAGTISALATASSPAQVPEPSTLFVLPIGSILLFWSRLRGFSPG